jgi:heme-degrading monooxygenase HmoA
MITVANRIFVKPEYGEAFERFFVNAPGSSMKCRDLSRISFAPVNDGDPYIVFTLWNSREDFMNWVRSDAFIKGHAQSGTLPKDAYSRAKCWKCMKSCRIRRVPI